MGYSEIEIKGETTSQGGVGSWGNLRATKRTTTEHASLVVSGSIGRQSKGEKRSVHYGIKSARRVFESHGEKSFGND